MKQIRRTLTVVFTLIICFTFVPAAFAHPLGNFTINQYAGLQVSREAIVIDYVLDMAEIPAFQEIALFDANGDGKPNAAETAGYHAGKCASLQPNLKLNIDRQPVKLSLASSSVGFPTGVGGLATLRLSCEFQAAVGLLSSNVALSFRNEAFPDRLGWTEVVVMPDGVALQGEFSSTSPSHRLANYPQDLLTSPLEQRGVEFEITAIGQTPEKESSSSAGGTNLSNRDDAFTRLILFEEMNLSAFLLALAISFLWGGMHAMTPGHGKTIVGAYLVGSRGTLKHALYLGLTTTITHTLGVFALGLITLFAAQYILPETLYPWTSLLSGLFVVGIGTNLFLSRFRVSGIARPRMKTNITKSSLSPVFERGHSQAGRPLHSHNYVLSASREHLHLHDHGHPHVHRRHDHEDHTHHAHEHGDHSHLPPERVTWRSLLVLGVSGGLVPCPSALVVMLGAIALNRIGFGLILVLAFSLGLAGALTAIGMLFIYAGRLFERFPAQGRIVRLLPVLSALFVSMIGVAIVLKGLREMRIM
jgi:ABC-type nickel/cobalt efflux system permease component RcnA